MNTYVVTTTKGQTFTVTAPTRIGAGRIAKRRAWSEFQAGVALLALVSVI